MTSDLLRNERANLSFSIQELSQVLYGGPEGLKKHLFLQHIIANDPVFRKNDGFFNSRSENYARSLEKCKRMIELMYEHNIAPGSADYYRLVKAVGIALPIALHSDMFIPTIVGQGTEAQVKKWLPKALNFEIIGTYVQTELGHGSFVRGIETTATYNPEKKVFVLHSPTISSTKWWPGGLGVTSNHCVVMARLILKGKDYGVHAFITQIRSLTDHRPLPGVEVGDIGPKFGYNTNDNGFLRFNKYEVPLDAMLMKYSQVTEDGQYKRPPHAKLSYGTMVRVRVGIIMEATQELGRALTIAVRYSAVRKQFPTVVAHHLKNNLLVNPNPNSNNVQGQNRPSNNPNVEIQTNSVVSTPNPNISQKTSSPSQPDLLDISFDEEVILNYQTHQYKLLPLVATAYAFHFTGTKIDQLLQTFDRQAKQGTFSLIQELHAASSGLKSLTTGIVCDAIEICRQACGGHGYSKFSALPDLYANYVPSATYEGENTVMMLQTSRFLLKQFAYAQQGGVSEKRNKKAGKSENDESESTGKGGMAVFDPKFVANVLQEKCSAKKPEDFLDPELQIRMFCHRFVRMTAEVAQGIQQETQNGASMTVALENHKVAQVRTATAYCWYLVQMNFINAVRRQDTDELESVTESLITVLKDLSNLFTLWHVEKNLGEFNEDGYLSREQSSWIRGLVRGLLRKVRRQAVGLVDAFQFTDHYLNSALGAYDGDYATRLYQLALQEPLNNVYPPVGYHEYIKPLVKGDIFDIEVKNSKL